MDTTVTGFERKDLRNGDSAGAHRPDPGRPDPPPRLGGEHHDHRAASLRHLPRGLDVRALGMSNQLREQAIRPTVVSWLGEQCTSTEAYDREATSSRHSDSARTA
jgi:hypothetical protein